MTKTIGQMRERITILSPARKKDAVGGYTLSWAKKETVWAYVKPRASPSAPPFKRGWNRLSYTIHIRTGPPLFPQQHILWRHKRLKISTAPLIDYHRGHQEVVAYEIIKGSSDDE